MGIAEALGILSAALGTATNLMAQAQQISALIQQAQAQGRTTFTADEWAVIQSADTQARAMLVQAITKALQG